MSWRYAVRLLNFLKGFIPRQAGAAMYSPRPIRQMGTEPMSGNTIRVALRRMGFSNEEMTAHGFRSLGSTRLNEMGFQPDVIEAALAHTHKGVRGIYNRSEYWEQRRDMMEIWADEIQKMC